VGNSNDKSDSWQDESMKRRVFFATQQYATAWSGLGSYARWLINTMVQELPVMVVHPGPKVDNGIDQCVVHGLSWDLSHGHWFSLSWRYYRILRQQNPESIQLIHFTDAREAFFSVLLLPQHLRAKMVGTQHDSYFAAFRCKPDFYRKRYLDGWRRWLYYAIVNTLERIALQRLPHIISNTDYVGKKVATAYRLRNLPQTIYIGLDDAMIARAGESPVPVRKKRQILFVGGNMQRKGILQLAQAIKLIVNDIDEFKVLVIGRDNNQARIMERLRLLGVDRFFDFRGFVPPEDLPVHYRQSLALVMPTLIEAYGLVFLEAILYGCPFVAGQRGGTPELIRNAGFGQLVDAYDAGNLAAILRQIFSSGWGVSEVQKKHVEIPKISTTMAQTLAYYKHRQLV
jgi:glycosyltransferase involved in cell wall biosynthesis